MGVLDQDYDEGEVERLCLIHAVFKRYWDSRPTQ